MTLTGIRTEPFKWVIVAAAAVVGFLQVLGGLQVRNEPYRGYRTRGEGVITEVARGGPADRAGLRVGDRLIRVDGTDARDRRADEARLRVRIGQIQTIAVDRGGRTVEARLAITGLPPMAAAAYMISVLTGLSFLACGLFTYLSAPRLMSRLLAVVGIGVGGVFTEMAPVASPLARALQETGLTVAGVFGFAALFHLMLGFTGERRLFRAKAAALAIYGPAAIICTGLVLATILARGQRGDLVDLTTTLALVLVLLYFCLAIAAFLLGYVTTTRAERVDSGFNVLGVCLLLGLAPILSTAIGLAAPGIVLPGSEYYDIAWVLIPFALARAVLLHARNGRGPESEV